MTPMEWGLLGYAIANAALEYWLGRTDKVKAGSTVEAILNGAKTVLSLVFKKKA